ncbi:hypothetical protein I317_03209 [Kwoniella heveanensis CBS 569]|nr:hypothetical protein I317_03209 [Kwoniella heveanensis CBS 569]
MAHLNLAAGCRRSGSTDSAFLTIDTNIHATLVGKDGRIWAQTGCDGTTGTPNCKIGNCGGGVCDGNQYGTPGATLAEFGMGGYGGQDFYDISMVDGYNLPMQIDVQGCPTASCGVQQDILEICDPTLVYPKGSDKMYTPVCCQHAGAGVDAVDCPNTYIPFYKKLKELCHDGYIYPKDDMYPGSILACPGDSNPAYTVTFCPNGVGAALNPPDVSSCSPLDSTPGDNAGNHEGGGATSPIWGETLQGEIISGAGSVTNSSGSTSGAASPVSTVAGVTSVGGVPSVASVPAGTAVSQSVAPPPPVSSAAEPYVPSISSAADPPPPVSTTPVASDIAPTPSSISALPPAVSQPPSGSGSESGSLFIPGVSSIPSEPNESPVAGPPGLSSSPAVPPASSTTLAGPLNLAATSSSPVAIPSSHTSGAVTVPVPVPSGGHRWNDWGDGSGANWRRERDDADDSGNADTISDKNAESGRLDVLARHRDRSIRLRRSNRD